MLGLRSQKRPNTKEVSLSSRFNSASAEIARYKIKETSIISDKQRDTKSNSFINEVMSINNSALDWIGKTFVSERGL
ncbi:17118_t:CDS:2 [Gigaspora margarita]|uniref:17118_t:CDS:1 n=1 Tax=Gigaspora margarita TaxID=4874 RepID=A0ABM8W4N5_GIGMA|nr:17118_t:CDS:2 [Gigaspora margarita]